MSPGKYLSIFGLTIMAAWQSPYGLAQDFDAMGDMIGSVGVEGAIGRSIVRSTTSGNFDGKHPVKTTPIAAPTEVTDITWQFETPAGWSLVSPGIIEGPDGVRLAVLDITERLPEGKSKDDWLERRVDILFAGEQIVDHDIRPEWKPGPNGRDGTLRYRLWTAADGGKTLHILQAAFLAESVQLFATSASPEAMEKHSAAIKAASGTMLGTLAAQRTRYTIENNPVTVKAPQHVKELPGVSWTMQPGMSYRGRGKVCAWQCVTFDPEPWIIVHERLPLVGKAAIETLAAAWDDPVVDRIKGPVLNPWFEGTGLSPEILFEYLGASTAVGHLLVPVESEAGTVVVEMRAFAYEMAARLPTFLAFINTMRVDGAVTAAAGSAGEPEFTVSVDRADIPEHTPITEAAAAAFQEACAGGDAEGCAGLANAYYLGEGVSQDRAKATGLYQQACDGGSGEGCYAVGDGYYFGFDADLDLAKAASQFQRSCDMGYPLGCRSLAGMYAKGEGVDQDGAKATSLYQRACDMGDSNGCESLGETENAAVGQAPAADAAASQDGCSNLDAQGCFDLAGNYSSGKGVTKDRAKAGELYQQACDGGHAQGCVYAGAIHAFGDQQDLPKAEALLLQGCELGDPEGCTHVAHMYALGRDVEKDHAKAASLLQKACDLGAEESCRDLREFQNDDVGQTIAQTVSRNMDNGLLLIDRLKGNDAEASFDLAQDEGLAITPGVWAFELRDDKDEVVNAESHCISRPVFDPKDFEKEEDGRTCASEVASMEGSHAIYHYACTGAEDSDFGIDLTIDGDRADGSFIFLEPDDGERDLHRGQVYKLTMQRTGGC